MFFILCDADSVHVRECVRSFIYLFFSESEAIVNIDTMWYTPSAQ